MAQDAQEFVGGGVRAASAGFPFGEGGLRNAEGGGKVSLIETETAADVRNKGGGVAVWRDMAADDKGAAGRVEWKVVPEADPEGLLCNIVELSGYVLRVGRMMAAIAAEFREGADVSVIFLTPADDAGEMGSEKSFFEVSYFGRHEGSVAAWDKRIKNSLHKRKKR